MSQVSQVRLATGVVYEIGEAGSSTKPGTSGDSLSPTAYTDVALIATSESANTFFNKVTTMVKNIRYIFSKLGTTDITSTGATTVTGAIAALQTNKSATGHGHTIASLPYTTALEDDATKLVPSSVIKAAVDGKAASTHSHTVSTLPIQTTVTDDDTKVPTGGAVVDYTANFKQIKTGMVTASSGVASVDASTYHHVIGAYATHAASASPSYTGVMYQYLTDGDDNYWRFQVFTSQSGTYSGVTITFYYYD